GTITTGRMTVHGVHPVDGVAEDELLRLAGAVEAASEHPVGTAIAAAAETALGPLPPVTEFANTPGQGVTGMVDGRAVVAGRATLLAEWGLPVDGPLAATKNEIEAAARTAVLVGWDGQLRGAIAVGDMVKDTSAVAVAELRDLGLHPVLLTGDNAVAARAIAETVGIDEVIAEVRPEQKVAAVRELQDRGRVVAMVGDG